MIFQRKSLVRAVIPFLAFSLGLAPGFGQDKGKAQTPGSLRSLSEILNPDGSLRIGPGARGSFDPRGFRLASGPGNQPRFVPSGLQPRAEDGAALLAAGDENWDPQFGNLHAGGYVRSIAVSGTDVYFGGYFTQAGGISANYVARWNAVTKTWSALGSGVDSYVYALAVSGTDVYVGGLFSNAGGNPAWRIAKWNGNSWSALGSGLGGGTVQAIAVNGTDVYVGGDFTTAGGSPANRIAKWSTSTNSWSALGSGVDYTVWAMAVSGPDVYVAGDFDTAGGITVNNIARWNGSAWSALGTGLGDAAYTVVVNGTDIYVGGAFTTAGGTGAAHVSRWNGSAWSPLGSGMDNTVYSMVLSGTDLYMGGAFTVAGGEAAAHVAEWDIGANTWSALGSGVSAGVVALGICGTRLYAGGDFSMAGGVMATRIATWDMSEGEWRPQGNGLNADVNVIAMGGTNVYAGGDFTQAGGIPTAHIARWNGAIWSPLGMGVSGRVYAIAVDGSDVYVGGNFVYGGDGSTVFNYIAKWNEDAATWSPLGAGMNGVVRAIAVNGTDVYAGGYFTQAGGSPASYIAKWNGTAWSDVGGGTSAAVYTISMIGGFVYAGGQFVTAGGVTANGIARFNGATWSGLGDGVSAGAVYGIMAMGSNIYVCGDFTFAGGLNSFGLAIWNDSTGWSEAPHSANWPGLYTYTMSASGTDLYVGIWDEFGMQLIRKLDTSTGTWSYLGSGVGPDGEFPWVFGVGATGKEVFIGGKFTTAGESSSYHFGRWMVPLAVTSPNGGESWEAGTLQDITWKGTSGPVRIEYSTDNGATWIQVASSTENDGTHPWVVPDSPSSSCLIRISEAADGSPADTSDGTFAIAGFRVTSPNGGEVWTAGTEQTITWNTVGSYPTVSLQYSLDNGGAWNDCAGVVANTGSCPWMVPNTPSAQCLVRVRDSIDAFPSDASDATFAIIPTGSPIIAVTSPNGGESWSIGSTHDITWTSAGITGDVTIMLYQGVMSVTLGTASAISGVYPWAINPGLSPGEDYRIRVWQAAVEDYSDGYFSLEARRDDLVGTWDGQGVYYRNSDTAGWVKLASPATKITVGDLDGDEIDDLIGLWPGQGGIWVRYSQSGSWAKLSSTARYIAAGDMNGDGRVDLVGTWDGQGVYYRNSISGAWVKLASPATMVTAGDIDKDGTDDLIGLWPSQGGIWVRYSQSGSWARLSSTAVHIAAGDMNGDGRDDLVGTWDGQGVYYRDSASGAWVKMASPATLIATGDLDGDATADLIGIWPTQGGVWVKDSGDATWHRLSSTAADIAAGKMRAVSIGSEARMEAFPPDQQELKELPFPAGGTEEGPGVAGVRKDLSDKGPGGARFIFLEDINLEPVEDPSARLTRVPGPGEPGFMCVEQTSLYPGESREINKRPPAKELKGSKRR